MQRDWIDYASAAGSIATALTLLYLVLKEWKTRKDITDLGVIAKQIQEQNDIQKKVIKHQARPKFKVTSELHDSGDSFSVTLSILNEGASAFINYTVQNGEVRFGPFYGYEIETGQTANLMTESSLMRREAPYQFMTHIYYADYFGNRYIASVFGDVLNQPDVRIQEDESPPPVILYNDVLESLG